MNRIYIIIPVCALICAVLAAPVILILRNGRAKNKKLLIAGWLFLLIFIARLLVAWLAGIVMPEESSGLSFAEELMNGLIHGLQTFSMDEDYTDYTVRGKELLITVGLTNWAPVYGLVISVLNLCAPILGGAILLDILTNLFPKLRLRFLKNKDVYVFSEMNEASVSLAEDICRDGHYEKIKTRLSFHGKPVLVFTDTYPDATEETRSELLDRTRGLGAICVKEDLRFLSFRQAASVTYFLLDTAFGENINTLEALLENDGEKYYRTDVKGADAEAKEETAKTKEELANRVRIYLFAEESDSEGMVRNICSRYEENADQVLIRVVKSYRNAVMNLMHDVPLFLPLMYKPREERKDLYVTVFGDSCIAEELFKTAFWCGQINGTQLHLNMVGTKAELFEKQLRLDCPELLASCDPQSDILNIRPLDPRKEKNPPYSTMPRFIQIEDSSCLLDIPGDIIEKTDYFAVAFDSDQENLSAVTRLRDQVVRSLLEKRSTHRPVIAAAVFDRTSGMTLEELNPAPAHPLVYTFADRQSRFDCENVFLLNYLGGAKATAELYSKKNQNKVLDDEYSFWSNMTRTIHAPCKLYGIGAVSNIRLRGHGLRSEHVYEVPVHCDSRQSDELAWIEHRRWNAFMRTQGFRCPSKAQLDYYFTNPELPKATHKYVEARLHVCLVEYSKERVPVPDPADFSSEKNDCLDFAAMYIQALREAEAEAAGRDKPEEKTDFKRYDYPEEDSELKDLVIK
ncbi:MAG: hypothetical protein LUG93_14720 [Lachnospiraceae bacterium]|nr:hypothetical protein [Lachnospiraceae bacterium]